MGSYKNRGRRPFIWQDEMAEVKNLFRKVAKVRSSGFTGFSVWKDEPTAETLSKNRLRRRRSQYAFDLTHLNYRESPYEALNHLHNIRGMCSRIQRQDLHVERKKKDYDADLHPSLLRRPVTALACNEGWDGGDRASLCRRPSSAPCSIGTPLHYTAPKPTVLYDATHRCPRYRSLAQRPSSSVSSSRSGRSVQSVRGATWESSSVLSSVRSTPVPSSIANHSPSQSTSTSYKLNTEYARKEDVPSSRIPRSTTDGEVSTSLYSSDIETGSPDLSSSILSMDQRPSSRFTGPATAQERPPSRQVSKRPPRQQQQHAEGSKSGKRDDLISTVRSVRTPKSCKSRITQPEAPDFPTASNNDEVLISSKSRQSSSRKDKDKLSDRSCGLWALKQEQHRPITADQVTPSRAEDQKQKAPPSPSYPDAFSPSCPSQVKARLSDDTLEGNKKTGKRDDMPTMQSCIDHLDKSSSETENSVRTEPEVAPTSPLAHSCVAKSFGHQSSSSSGADEAHNTEPSVAGDDSPVLIKHSTDPYADFKTSMMHMINEEGLIYKQWELEELFQYYMDLNPVVHHDILKRVICDIRRDLAAENASR